MPLIEAIEFLGRAALVFSLACALGFILGTMVARWVKPE
jgi:hypothetical protein